MWEETSTSGPHGYSRPPRRHFKMGLKAKLMDEKDTLSSDRPMDPGLYFFQVIFLKLWFFRLFLNFIQTPSVYKNLQS